VRSEDANQQSTPSTAFNLQIHDARFFFPTVVAAAPKGHNNDDANQSFLMTEFFFAREFNMTCSASLSKKAVYFILRFDFYRPESENNRKSLHTPPDL
jgi:hypothetical protein